MNNSEILRTDYYDIAKYVAENFPLDVSKNYLFFTGHMERPLRNGNIDWELLNREAPVTDFEYTNFKSKQEFENYIGEYIEDGGSLVAPISRHQAVSCWKVLFIQDMDAKTYFDIVNNLIEFDDDFGRNTMSFKDFEKFISVAGNFSRTATYTIVGPDRPILITKGPTS